MGIFDLYKDPTVQPLIPFARTDIIIASTHTHSNTKKYKLSLVPQTQLRLSVPLAVSPSKMPLKEVLISQMSHRKFLLECVREVNK